MESASVLRPMRPSGGVGVTIGDEYRLRVEATKPALRPLSSGGSCRLVDWFSPSSRSGSRWGSRVRRERPDARERALLAAPRSSRAARGTRGGGRSAVRHPRTLRLGGFGLLAALAIALIVHGLNGEIPWLLLPCAAGTAFVLVHGPVPWSWLRARDSGV